MYLQQQQQFKLSNFLKQILKNILKIICKETVTQEKSYNTSHTMKSVTEANFKKLLKMEIVKFNDHVNQKVILSKSMIQLKKVAL